METKKKVKLADKKQFCEDCHGTGHEGGGYDLEPGEAPIKCDYCSGRGVLYPWNKTYRKVVKYVAGSPL